MTRLIRHGLGSALLGACIVGGCGDSETFVDDPSGGSPPSCNRQGHDVCSGSCIDLRDDANNCGACGTSCGDDEYCAGGSCQSLNCNEHTVAICDHRCVSELNAFHCGGVCGTSCALDERCDGSACVPLSGNDYMIWPDPLVGGGYVVGLGWHTCAANPSDGLDAACRGLGLVAGGYGNNYITSTGGQYTEGDLASVSDRLGTARDYDCDSDADGLNDCTFFDSSEGDRLCFNDGGEVWNDDHIVVCTQTGGGTGGGGGGMGGFDNDCEAGCAYAASCGLDFCDLASIDCGTGMFDCAGTCLLAADCAAINSLNTGMPDTALGSCLVDCES